MVPLFTGFYNFTVKLQECKYPFLLFLSNLIYWFYKTRLTINYMKIRITIVLLALSSAFAFGQKKLKLSVCSKSFEFHSSAIHLQIEILKTIRIKVNVLSH